jgi:4-amino-4-deoxy-L-arabinose transferase-like glycosyltransferase
MPSEMNRTHGFQWMRNWKEILLLAAILAVAAVLRLYRLDQLPPGLHYDEAFDAIHAQKVLAGVEHPIFFPDNLAEEPMSIYAAAAVFGLWGASPWSLRLSSALAGIVNVAALYLLAREFLPGSNKKRMATAALAALVLAVLYWHVNFSRLGMEPIFLPLMLTLSFLFLWRGLRRLTADSKSKGVAGLVDFALAGLFFGAVQFTYKAGLFAPFFLVAFLMVEFAVNPPFWFRYWRGLVVLAVMAVLVFAPLGLYFWTHPEVFLERPTAVTATSLNVGTLSENADKVAGMFFIQGDENPRSDLPGRPALDPFLAIGFVAGLMACLLRMSRPHQRGQLDGTASRFLLLWLMVMVLPSVVTDYAPHFGRSIGVTPAIAMLVAIGFVELVDLVQARAAGSNDRARRVAPIILSLGLTIGLVGSAFSTVHAYFDVWAARTGLFDSFDAGYLAVAEKLRDRPANELIYLSPFADEHYTIDYGLGGREAREFDGRRVLIFPPPGSTATYGVVTREDTRSIDRLAKAFPTGRVTETLGDLTGAPYASLFHVEGVPQIAPQQFVRAGLGDTAQLIGYDLARETNAIALTIYWGCIADMDADYTVFVHLVGPVNPVAQSPVWTQDDAMPGHGTYPTSRWQAGEVIVDDYRLALPADMPRGEYEIEVGMYTVKTGARVRVTDENGVPMENDRVLFERIALP